MRSRGWIVWAFMAPVLLVMAIIVFYPLAVGVFQTFTNIDSTNQGTRFKPPSWEFVGLQNYIDILTGEETKFYPVLIWTVIWTAVNVFFHYTIGLLAGPHAESEVPRPDELPDDPAVAVGGAGLHHGDLVVVHLQRRVRPVEQHSSAVFGIPAVPWLSTWPWYYIMPIIVNVWLGIPFMMVVLLGGLQSIPGDLYEAAPDGWRHATTVVLEHHAPAAQAR